MAATYRGSAVVCDGSTTIAGPIQWEAIQNDATTSASITRAGTEIWSGGAGAGAVDHFPFRSAGPVVVTVTGGGTVTIYLKTDSNR